MLLRVLLSWQYTHISLYTFTIDILTIHIFTMHIFTTHIFTMHIFIMHIFIIHIFTIHICMCGGVGREGGVRGLPPYVITHVHAYAVAAPGFWFGGGNLGQNFIHDFHSSPVLQWHRHKFGLGGVTFSNNVLIKEFWKNLKIL